MIRLILVLTLMTAFLSNTWADTVNFGQRVVGVEQKSAMQDQGIDVVSDLTYGVSFNDIADKWRSMGVNFITIPVSTVDHGPTINYVSSIANAFGTSVAVVLSSRRWNLDLAGQRENWAQDLANSYNALNNAGLSHLVKGFRVDETDPLNGVASSTNQWTSRFNHIEQMADLLNNKTANALTTRSLIIHGEGYGSNFNGVAVGHTNANFDNDIQAKAGNYAFSFKMFDSGSPVNGNSSSIAEWEAHYRVFNGLDDLSQVGRPVMFVGNAGDGLFLRSFAENFDASWTNSPKGLANVFREKGFHHFAFGPFLADASSTGRTVLHRSFNGVLTENTEQMFDWNQWKSRTARSSSAPIGETIWFRSIVNQKIVAVDANGAQNPLSTVDSSALPANAQFIVEDAGSGLVRFRSVGTDRYVRADWSQGSQGPIKANTFGTGTWTKFRWHSLNGNTLVRLEWNNSGLSVRPEFSSNKDYLEADATSTGTWTRFNWGPK